MRLGYSDITKLYVSSKICLRFTLSCKLGAGQPGGHSQQEHGPPHPPPVLWSDQTALQQSKMWDIQTLKAWLSPWTLVRRLSTVEMWPEGVNLYLGQDPHRLLTVMINNTICLVIYDIWLYLYPAKINNILRSCLVLLDTQTSHTLLKESVISNK